MKFEEIKIMDSDRRAAAMAADDLERMARSIAEYRKALIPPNANQAYTAVQQPKYFGNNAVRCWPAIEEEIRAFLPDACRLAELRLAARAREIRNHVAVLSATIDAACGGAIKPPEAIGGAQ